jgi:glutamyl endopeptidase
MIIRSRLATCLTKTQGMKAMIMRRTTIARLAQLPARAALLMLIVGGLAAIAIPGSIANAKSTSVKVWDSPVKIRKTASFPTAAARPGLASGASAITPMVVVRVARLVTSIPSRAGQVQVQLVNGAVIGIPAADKKLVLHPKGTKHGSCGSSWIYQYDKADAHPIKIYTGFDVKTAAIAYKWYYKVTGPSGSWVKASFSGTLAFRHTWSNTYNTPEDFPAGEYSAKVTAASSALLATGTICYSLQPTARNRLSSPDAPVEWKLDSSPIIVTTAPPPVPVTATVLPAFGGRVGDLRPHSVAGSGGLKRVTDTAVYPYRAIARLELFYKHDKDVTCSGFLISKNLVVTAGHCLYYPGDGYALRVIVSPGYDVGVASYGSCLGTTAYSVTGWVDDLDRRYDYGAIKLNCSIGNQVGWFGMRSTPASLTGTAVTATGYPFGAKPEGSMWTASGPITGSGQRQLTYHIPTPPGMSGGPVYERGPYALAIIAWINLPRPGVNAGTRITQAAFDNFVEWLS